MIKKGLSLAQLGFGDFPKPMHWSYTCRITVGIPKTAIGVTALLLPAVSETAMAAKN